MIYTTMDNTHNKFKAVERDAVDAPVKDIEWEGEHIQANSDTKLEQDTGTGEAVVLRFFDFAANPDSFRMHKPTAQELFDVHRKGIESLLWTDGMRPYQGVEPRLMFSKDKKYYRFAITCIVNDTLVDKTKTLSELLANTRS